MIYERALQELDDLHFSLSVRRNYFQAMESRRDGLNIALLYVAMMASLFGVMMPIISVCSLFALLAFSQFYECRFIYRHASMDHFAIRCRVERLQTRIKASSSIGCELLTEVSDQVIDLQREASMAESCAPATWNTRLFDRCVGEQYQRLYGPDVRTREEAEKNEPTSHDKFVEQVAAIDRFHSPGREEKSS